jgi:hypothetical protein
VIYEGRQQEIDVERKESERKMSQTSHCHDEEVT